MKVNRYICSVLWALFVCPYSSYSQEGELKTEESAEVFLEEYSDKFQENFFEALKQKGIENYDKAVNLLLECKNLDPENSTVDHELAKAYFEDKKWMPAQQHAIEALLSEPDNIWYLNTLIAILQKQGGSIESLGSKIPITNVRLRENLALIYFEHDDYEGALHYIKDLKDSRFKEDLTLKIRDSIQRQKSGDHAIAPESPVEPTNGTAEEYTRRLNDLITKNSVPLIRQVSVEALEIYPSHPFFYYAQGYALNRDSNPGEAVEVLETALDYLLDDVSLADLIHRELADAYTALGNSSKANMYLRKLKP